MMNIIKILGRISNSRIFISVLFLFCLFVFVGVSRGHFSPASIASGYTTIDARNFNIKRRILIYNASIDKYILEVKGRCYLDSNPSLYIILCKLGDDSDQYVISKKILVGKNKFTIPIVTPHDIDINDEFKYVVNHNPIVK